MNEPLDLGSGFSLRFFGWSPDRGLNPQYDQLPDLERAGALLTCQHGIEGAIHFDHGQDYAQVFKDRPSWTVESWEPLTLSPSVDCGCCHGFIREGRWIPA